MTDPKTSSKSERKLGTYTIFIMQSSHSGWTPSVMQLDGVVTNYRLMLRPSRKRLEPAVLPKSFIRRFEIAIKSNYHCVAIKLITDDYLYLGVSTGNLNDFYDDLRAMKLPAPRFGFDHRISRAQVERLAVFLYTLR